MILHRSTTQHAWRTTWAYTALTMWLLLAVYWLMNGPVLHLLRLGWWGDYPTGPISG